MFVPDVGVARHVGIDVPADVGKHSDVVVVVIGPPNRLRAPLNDLRGRRDLLWPWLDQEVQSRDGE